MYIWPILAVIFASLEALAVSRNLPRLEYVAKPAVMASLFIWLYTSTGLQGKPLWFGLGILFSLVGDLLLTIPSDRMFLFGLIAFLFAHISYIAGFADSLGTQSMWSLLMLVLIIVSVIRLIQRIVGAMRAQGQNKLIYPVIVYGSVISLMLYAAISTIYDLTWKTSAAFFVSAGAFLFWTSDLILAWNKFVAPVKNGRIFNIVTYYLGQIGLIAGVIFQFR
jgi:uncharacterized membrane protein YhhN